MEILHLAESLQRAASEYTLLSRRAVDDVSA